MEMKIEFKVGDLITIWTEQGTKKGEILGRKGQHHYDNFGNGYKKQFTYYEYEIKLVNGEIFKTVESGKLRHRKADKLLPKGYDGNGCPKLIEEYKGAASFRMWETSTGKLHIEVWTPNMGRRKVKEPLIGMGSNPAYVENLYKKFLDYEVPESPTACFVTEHGAVIPIDYNSTFGICVVTEEQRVAVEFEQLKYSVNEIRVPLIGFGKSIGALNNIGVSITKNFKIPTNKIDVQEVKELIEWILELMPPEKDFDKRRRFTAQLPVTDPKEFLWVETHKFKWLDPVFYTTEDLIQKWQDSKISNPQNS